MTRSGLFHCLKRELSVLWTELVFARQRRFFLGTSLITSRTLFIGSIVILFSILTSEVAAQSSPGVGQSSSQSTSEHAQASSSATEGPFVHGLVVGVGLTTFHGDVDSDPPDRDIVQRLTSADFNARIGIDRRFGASDQFGAGVHLVYDRISGRQIWGPTFTNNMVSLEVTGESEIPYIGQGWIRVFGGGGPTFLVSPSYSNYGDSQPPSVFRTLGSRVVGTFVVGVTIADRVRIGTRIAPTDFLDGYRGSGSHWPFDLLGFLNIGYRFDLSD